MTVDQETNRGAVAVIAPSVGRSDLRFHLEGTIGLALLFGCHWLRQCLPISDGRCPGATSCRQENELILIAFATRSRQRSPHWQSQWHPKKRCKSFCECKLTRKILKLTCRLSATIRLSPQPVRFALAPSIASHLDPSRSLNSPSG